MSDSKETPSVNFERCFAHTSFKSQRRKFWWRVTDWMIGLPNFQVNSNTLSSPLFENSDGYKWKLQLVIQTGDRDEGLCMRAILRLEEGPVKNVMVIGSLGIEGVKQKMICAPVRSKKSPKIESNYEEYRPRLSPLHPDSKVPSTVETDLIPYEEKMDNIVVIADFKYSVDRVTEVTNAYKSESLTRSEDDSNYQKAKLCKALGHLLRSGRESDMSIIIQGTRAPAHRAILSARSPVFEAMIYEADIKQSVLELEIDCDNFRAGNAFLTFIYTGEISVDAQELLRMGNALFILQKKFKVDSLSDHLTARFLSMLNYETVLDVLEIAFQHGVTQLITEGTQELRKHLSRLKMEKRSELASFVQRHAEIAMLLVDLC